MKAVVTGVAGFIGSTLAERLVTDGWTVCGIDAFTDYYTPAVKRANVAGLDGDERFTLVEADLLGVDVAALLDGADVVFHQAAQPGVRMSWEGFESYSTRNVVATQRLLDAARDAGLSRFVYASSSSVYGEASRYPTTETDATRPRSPYGLTKLAGELLCGAYAANFDVPVVSLRYFSVYGPRQRPDMAVHRLIEAARRQTPFPRYGDGSHVRDLTFVDDVVTANLLAATAPVEPGTVVNIAGGSTTTLAHLIELVGCLVGSAVPVQVLPAQPGDVQQTGGATELAEQLLGWRPTVSMEAGLRAQIDWHGQQMP